MLKNAILNSVLAWKQETDQSSADLFKRLLTKQAMLFVTQCITLTSIEKPLYSKTDSLFNKRWAFLFNFFGEMA